MSIYRALLNDNVAFLKKSCLYFLLTIKLLVKVYISVSTGTVLKTCLSKNFVTILYSFLDFFSFYFNIDRFQNRSHQIISQSFKTKIEKKTSLNACFKTIKLHFLQINGAAVKYSKVVL